jgi:hypothetical protein
MAARVTMMNRRVTATVAVGARVNDASAERPAQQERDDESHELFPHGTSMLHRACLPQWAKPPDLRRGAGTDPLR